MQDQRDIPVAILAGGLGTRLRPALANCHKTLAPVNGRPFITYLLDQLAEASFRKVVLLTGHGADQVRQTLGNEYQNLQLTYARETSPLGTGGALRQALPQLVGRTILLMNGDSYGAADLARFVAEHRARRAEFSMVLAQVPDASRFGAVEFRADGRITRFREKQKGIGPGWINAGIYLLEKSLAETIPAEQMMSLERDLLPVWLKMRRVFSSPSAGRFLDIGTPASYAGAEEFFQAARNECLTLTG